MHWDRFDICYVVASHFLSALINGDESGLDDEDRQALERFLVIVDQDAPDGYVFAHWATADNADEFGRDEITGLRAQVETVKAVFRDR